MVPQKKEDIVCCFHDGLEVWMKSIDMRMAATNKKLDKLLLWKTSVVGYSAGACAVIVLIFKYLKVL